MQLGDVFFESDFLHEPCPVLTFQDSVLSPDVLRNSGHHWQNVDLDWCAFSRCGFCGKMVVRMRERRENTRKGTPRLMRPYYREVVALAPGATLPDEGNVFAKFWRWLWGM